MVITRIPYLTSLRHILDICSMNVSQVRVKIVEARQLEGSNVHPICKITLFGESKSTRVRRSTGNPTWNEVFYYSNNISPAEIVDEMINFEVGLLTCC